ncbi:MAG: hypothetical protein LBR33_12470 [Propionibacteriaceae bacterium]|nr:hypothetical protein [Propionibacteriaceae bacterium]
MILPKERDPRFTTIRRGGTLTDDDHRLLALWAADCAEHVLPWFEAVRPDDDRPRRAIETGRAWARGEVTMTAAHNAAFTANAAAREVAGTAREAAHAAGQAAPVAHVAAHALGAAAYALRAVRAAATADGGNDGTPDQAVLAESRWQRDRLPDGLRDLVLDDMSRRNDLCWGVFTPLLTDLADVAATCSH